MFATDEAKRAQIQRLEKKMENRKGMIILLLQLFFFFWLGVLIFVQKPESWRVYPLVVVSVWILVYMAVFGLACYWLIKSDKKNEACIRQLKQELGEIRND